MIRPPARSIRCEFTASAAALLMMLSGCDDCWLFTEQPLVDTQLAEPASYIWHESSWMDSEMGAGSDRRRELVRPGVALL